MLERHVLELKQSTHIVVFRPDSVEDDAYPLSWPMNTCFLRPAAHTESTAPLLPRSMLRLT